MTYGLKSLVEGESNPSFVIILLHVLAVSTNKHLTTKSQPFRDKKNTYTSVYSLQVLIT